MRPLNRNEYTRRVLVRAAEAGLDVDGVDLFLDELYPKSTESACDECASRGFMVGVVTAKTFATERVPQWAGASAWRRHHIDALIAEAMDKPRVPRSRDMQDATDRGVSLACFLRLRDAQIAAARDAAAKACGVTFDEWIYAESCGGGGNVERGLRIANRIPNASDREYVEAVLNTARGGDDYTEFMRHLSEVRARRLAMESECDRRGFVDEDSK